MTNPEPTPCHLSDQTGCHRTARYCVELDGHAIMLCPRHARPYPRRTDGTADRRNPPLEVEHACRQAHARSNPAES